MSARNLSRFSPERVRIMAAPFGGDARIVTGKFAAATYADGRQVIVGGCRGDALTDHAMGCEGLIATLIVVPHVGVTLPHGLSWDLFLGNMDHYFREVKP